jgi:hypothetical protein
MHPRKKKKAVLCAAVKLADKPPTRKIIYYEKQIFIDLVIHPLAARSNVEQGLWKCGFHHYPNQQRPIYWRRANAGQFNLRNREIQREQPTACQTQRSESYPKVV